MNLALYTTLFFLSTALAIVLDSCIEWFVHRNFMHEKRYKTWPVVGYFFRSHAEEHHVHFKCATFHNDSKLHTIILKRWAGPSLILIASIPGALLSWYTQLWMPLAIFAVVATLYYILFEYIHIVMHSTKDHWFKRTKWFKFLTEHHHLHHCNWNKNFNLVIPLGDYLFKTLARTMDNKEQS